MIEIREEAPADQSHVDELVRAAFGSDMQAGLLQRLRPAANPQVSLVALAQETIVGHIFFSPVICAQNTSLPCAQLSPVSVQPEHQGDGIGSLLINAGVAQCALNGIAAVFLVGNPAYYSRFGFRFARERGLHCEGEHDPFLQYLEVKDDGLGQTQGLVSFHPEFAKL